jgi:hypothetical protein
LSRGLIFISLPWSGIELLCDGVALALGEQAHALALGQVLTDQAIGVFVAAAFPGVVGSGEVDGDAGGRFDIGVAVARQGSEHVFRRDDRV